MSKLYPLRFKPVFRQYLWGGRRLASTLGKPLGEGDDFAESWEVVDHGGDQSIVANGQFAGVTLGDLVSDHGPELFGRHHPQTQFPLLFKFLDCNRNLSVQVHPNDEQGAQLDPPDLGKTEAWVILAAQPGSVLYAGLKRGFDRAALAREIQRGTTELCLHKIEPEVGDCIFIPAGVVHALGEGLLVAEIQQASDTTYRLFDWNRVGTDGQPRPLHIDAGLDVIDYEIGPIAPQQAEDLGDGGQRLVSCDKFVLDRRNVSSTSLRMMGGDDRFHILSVVSGCATVTAGDWAEQLALGETLLLPACCAKTTIQAKEAAVLLDMYLP